MRTGMGHLVEVLREYCNAGTADYSDDKLEALLDRHRTDVDRVPLDMRWDTEPTATIYRDYHYPYAFVETVGSGTAVWRIEDSTGALVDSAQYTVNLNARQITFVQNTGGAVYYLTCRAYDVHRAAAELWRMKKATVAAQFDVKTDNHDLKRSQLLQHYEDMARTYERQAKARSVKVVRDD